MKKFNKDVLVFPTLTLVSLAVIAATIGAFTHNAQDCISAGFGAEPVGIGIISAGTFISGTGAPVYQCVENLTAIQEAEEQAQEEVTRNITTFVSSRTSFAAPLAFGMGNNFGGTQNVTPLSGSSDAFSGFTLWGDVTITQITEEHGNHFDTDIYQFTGGFDKAIDDVFFGSALSYAHTENEAGGTTSTSETVGITPYFAYKINDYMFASGLAGYIYTHTNRADGGIDLDNHDYLTEGNINLYKTIDSFILQGRAGIRYKHTISSPERGIALRDNSYDELTWIGDLELGYVFDSKLRIYTGLLYEYSDREQSGASNLVHDHIGFMRYGVNYPINNKLSIDAKIQHDIIEEDTDFISGSLNIRLAF